MSVTSARRSGWAIALTAALLLVPSAAGADRRQQPSKEQEKLEKEQRQHAEAALKLVDAVTMSEATLDSQPFQIGWANDFLKAQDGRAYIPFTIAVAADALSTPDVTIYLRVVSRAAPAEDEAAAKAPAPYAFEDVWFPELTRPGPERPYELSRAFAVPGGEYDVYVAVRERTADGKAAARAAVMKRTVTVPDFWNGELTTSSILVADAVEPLAEPLSPEAQVLHPYTIGRMQLTPAADRTFTTAEELSILFMVYNPAVKDKKPDIQVEYLFHQKTADGEQYFNRTPPTLLNAETLGAGFDLDAGYQLVAGQSVPLLSFPPGDYRLEIEVQDKLAGKTLKRDVLFTVAGS